MFKPNVKIKKRDIEFMSFEELNELLQDEICLSDPDVSEFSGQHSSNVILIRQYIAENQHDYTF